MLELLYCESGAIKFVALSYQGKERTMCIGSGAALYKTTLSYRDTFQGNVLQVECDALHIRFVQNIQHGDRAEVIPTRASRPRLADGMGRGMVPALRPWTVEIDVGEEFSEGKFDAACGFGPGIGV